LGGGGFVGVGLGDVAVGAVVGAEVEVGAAVPGGKKPGNGGRLLGKPAGNGGNVTGGKVLGRPKVGTVATGGLVTPASAAGVPGCAGVGFTGGFDVGTVGKGEGAGFTSGSTVVSGVTVGNVVSSGGGTARFDGV
jgi:hypothetical protein